MFIDTHAHLPLCKADIEILLTNAKKNDVTYIVNVGIDIKSSLEAYNLSKLYSQIIPTIGIHPSQHEDIGCLDEMERLIKECEFKAVGETGLDYFKNYTSKETQIKLFRAQLKLAKKHQLPVIIHNRKADDDVLAIIEEYKDLTKVFHCYSTNVEFAKKLLAPNTYFSFTGNITYSKKGKIIETIKYLPLENILLETDCPFLVPEKYKGQENQPAHVVEIAKKIAEIKQVSLDEVENVTTENALRFFSII
jgi:TatD DNase family protein